MSSVLKRNWHLSRVNKDGITVGSLSIIIQHANEPENTNQMKAATENPSLSKLTFHFENLTHLATLKM